MKIRHATIAAAVTAALIGGAALAVVTSVRAQDGTATPSAGRDEQQTRFLDRVAAKLGIETSVLRQAMKDAGNDIVDEKLAAGAITEEQAAKARARIENGRPGRAFDGRQDGKQKVRDALIEQAASALGMSTADLKSGLKSGKSIADVAAERGVALDDVKASILDAAKTKLDQAVANGRIDQPKADAALQKLTDRIDELLNKKRAAPSTP